MLSYRRLLFSLVIMSMLSGCSYRSKDISPKTTDKVQYTIVNDTQYPLSVIRKNVEWGRWVTVPASTIAPYSQDTFSSRGTITAGTEGNVEYAINSGSFDVYWSLSHWNSVKNRLTINDPLGKYNIYRNYEGSNVYTVYVKEKHSPKKYNILVMSDPQPWRLNESHNDPNSDKSSWESSNKKTASSLQLLEREKNFAFGIINGDITEFGRKTTRRSFDEIYSSSLKTKLLLGLGNHDYANNVNDCTEPDDLNFSKNACARGAFFDMIDRMDRYKAFLENYAADYIKSQQRGSGAYSWDKGDIHYVQLQNYPTYHVELDHYVNSTIHVKKSIDWLEQDLEKAFSRGKVTVLNFHDDYEHFKTATTDEEKQRLESMIKKYNVIAIFSGHSHIAGKSQYGFINGVMHYNSGALFQGDYLSVDVNGKCMDVSLYNGKSGTPELVSRYGTVCGK
ncbi:metallophosphoesterase [Enterobacteriaceae bacterium LUAb1]